MSDARLKKYAEILVDHSARIQPGDRVLIEATTAALPLVEELYALILQRGGHPYPALQFPNEEALFYKYASKDVLGATPSRLLDQLSD